MNPYHKSGLIIILLISATLTLSSIFIPLGSFTYSGDKSELADIRIGLPVPFMAQDLSHYDPPAGYRQPIGLANPLEATSRILWLQFIFSLVIVFSIVFVILAAIRYLVALRKGPATVKR